MPLASQVVQALRISPVQRSLEGTLYLHRESGQVIGSWYLCARAFNACGLVTGDRRRLDSYRIYPVRFPTVALVPLKVVKDHGIFCLLVQSPISPFGGVDLCAHRAGFVPQPPTGVMNLSMCGVRRNNAVDISELCSALACVLATDKGK